ncbi:hypothetical protein P6988_01945 [Vibrio coralliilyticus]|nr:hypothetical protein [Vibrio coralliilyticus]WFB48012.1 hypothetical protein P6988_01945 [Vibrio coralliilyticus]
MQIKPVKLKRWHTSREVGLVTLCSTLIKVVNMGANSSDNMSGDSKSKYESAWEVLG